MTNFYGNGTERLESIFEGAEKWYESELLPALKEESPYPFGSEQMSDDDLVTRWEHDLQAPYGVFSQRLQEYQQINPDMDQKRAFVAMLREMHAVHRKSQARRQKMREEAIDGDSYRIY